MSQLQPVPNKAGRYYANLSPVYLWALTLEAWLKNRSLSEEAGSLLCAKLMEREAARDRLLEKVAFRLGKTKTELEEAIYAGVIAADDYIISVSDKEA